MTAAEVIARAIDKSGFDQEAGFEPWAAGRRQSAFARANNILAALRGAGFAVVPREATDAMAVAAIDRNASRDGATIYHGVYRAMVAAAEGGE